MCFSFCLALLKAYILIMKKAHEITKNEEFQTTRNRVENKMQVFQRLSSDSSSVAPRLITVFPFVTRRS